MGVREKRLYDAWYAHNVSIWLDIKIIFKTIVTVLKRENVYTNNEPAEGKVEEKKCRRRLQMSKILFISNISNRIDIFVMASIAAAHSLDIDFYQAANWQNVEKSQIEADEKAYNIKIKSVPISRNPLAKTNLTAYKELVDFIKQERIDYIHCNTPTGGILGRLAGKKCKVKKVIYQAHGFHFYKGAPKKNWLVYYPVEKWLAHYTDALITINSEDFELAKTKFKLRKNGKVYYVPGVGIDTMQYNLNEIIREEKRLELGISLDAFVLVSVGELNANKNNSVIVSAMEKLKSKTIHYILCGVGEKQAELQEQADKAGLHDNVHFLGYRNDVKELYKVTDCFVMPSFREGLSRSIMEAMASGLPCVVSKIRGNKDLVVENKGGFLCEPTDSDSFAEAIGSLCNNKSLCEEMSRFNKTRIKEFDVSVVEKELRNIYAEILGEV